MRSFFVSSLLLIGSCGGNDSATPDSPGGPADASHDGNMVVDGGEGRAEAGSHDGGAAVETSVDATPPIDAPANVDAVVTFDGGEPDAESPDAACTAWTSWNEGLTGGQIGRVQFDPRVPGLAFATAGRQLYRSTDSGQTWTLDANDVGASIAQLEFPNASPTVVLAATSSGLRRSDDSGRTWTTQSLDGLGLTTLLIDRSSQQRIFAGGDQGLLMRSTNGGFTWRAASSGLPFGQVTSLIGDSVNPDNLVASLIPEDENGTWKASGVVARSTNGGTSWTTTLSIDAIVSRLSQCRIDQRIIYASTALGISKSLDGGTTWGPTLRAGTQVTDVAIEPANCDHLYAALYPSGVTSSTDGGLTWSPPTTEGIALQRGYENASALVADPNNAAIVLAATNDGVFRSTDGAEHWSSSVGFHSVSSRTLQVSPLAPGELWLASFGSGAWRRPTPSSTWQKVTLEQLPRQWLLTVYPDPFTRGRILVGAAVGGAEAWQSIDNGASFHVTNAVSLNPFAFASDPTDHNVAYMGTQQAGVFKSIDGGATWQPSNTGAATVFVRSLLVDSDPGRTLYAATETNGIVRSIDAGANWVATSMGLGAGSVQEILRFDGAGSSALYAWVEGAGVYRSQDGMTWAPTNVGLDALDGGGIVVDSFGSRMFVVAGSRVFSSADGTSWHLYDQACQPPAAGGAPVIVTGNGTRSLVVSAGANGVLAHPL